MANRGRTKRKLIGSISALAVLALLLVATPGVAGAAPLWSSIPKPFTCGAGGKIVPDNSCLKHTGFRPNAGTGVYGPWWSQVRNSKGNCTAYVAYRLQRNGAARLADSFGNAVGWRNVVRSRLGAKAVNDTPAVGSIAWYGAYGAPGVSWAGHVAYVERVSANGKAILLSESHFAMGSRRLIVRKDSSYWPNKFLHIKDQPTTKRPSNPVPAPSSPPITTPPTSPPPPISASPKPQATPKTPSPPKSTPKPSVGISKGNSAQGMPGCKSIYCRYIAVSFKNFPSGSHSIRCRASHGSEGGYYTYTRSGTSNNSAYCYYGFPGHTVWVTVDGVSSNKIVW